MNDHRDIDQLLHSALGRVQVDSGARPHLADVRHRARRMHHRRTAGVVGAFAVIGAAGVSAQALRHDARTNLQPGDGLGGPVSGSGLPLSDCHYVAPGSVPTVSTITLEAYPIVTSAYVIEVGDTPMGVAQKFAITLDELRRANAGNTALDAFVVGDAIAIPESPTTSYPTDTVSVSTGPGLYPAADTTLQCDSTAPTAPTVWGAQVDTTVQTFENQVTTTYFGQEAPPATGCAYDETPVYCGPPTTSLAPDWTGGTSTTSMG